MLQAWSPGIGKQSFQVPITVETTQRFWNWIWASFSRSQYSRFNPNGRSSSIGSNRITSSFRSGGTSPSISSIRSPCGSSTHRPCAGPVELLVAQILVNDVLEQGRFAGAGGADDVSPLAAFVQGQFYRFVVLGGISQAQHEISSLDISMEKLLGLFFSEVGH